MLKLITIIVIIGLITLSPGLSLYIWLLIRNLKSHIVVFSTIVYDIIIMMALWGLLATMYYWTWVPLPLDVPGIVPFINSIIFTLFSPIVIIARQYYLFKIGNKR